LAGELHQLATFEFGPPVGNYVAPLLLERQSAKGRIVMADLPKLNVVIANNFGHLPMFIGAEKGFFKNHGVDASFRVVDTGTDMVNALHNGEAQVGDMSTTTYLKAVHAGNPFQVIGLIMNDATDDRCDTPLAIVTRKGMGIDVGKIGDLRGKKVGLARGQTSDEYFKMVLRRASVKYEDVTIENIWSQFGLAPALKEGQVDAIVTKKGRGIEAGKLSDLKGKKIGLARGQTSDEYFKMVLRRAKMKYEDLTIENIWSQFGLAPALAEDKVDAVVSWEPFVTQALTQVPESYLVIRGGQHMSYVMVAVAHGPTVEAQPAVIRSIAAGLAQSSHFTRKNPDEAVEIFAKWVPGTDVAVGKKSIKHISFDPRMSPNVLRAFENAEDEVLMNTLKGAPRLDVPSLFRPQFMAEVQKEHPEYFADLPALK